MSANITALTARLIGNRIPKCMLFVRLESFMTHDPL
jgi:hypothetical protein